MTVAPCVAAAACMVLAALLPARLAAGEPVPPKRVEVGSVDLTAGDFFAAYTSKEPAQRERAEMFLLGVMDAGEGRQWCSYRAYKPHTVRERVFVYFRALQPHRLQDRAARVIAAALSESYPCKAETHTRLRLQDEQAARTLFARQWNLPETARYGRVPS